MTYIVKVPTLKKRVERKQYLVSRLDLGSCCTIAYLMNHFSPVNDVSLFHCVVHLLYLRLSYDATLKGIQTVHH